MDRDTGMLVEALRGVAAEWLGRREARGAEARRGAFRPLSLPAAAAAVCDGPRGAPACC